MVHYVNNKAETRNPALEEPRIWHSLFTIPYDARGRWEGHCQGKKGKPHGFLLCDSCGRTISTWLKISSDQGEGEVSGRRLYSWVLSGNAVIIWAYWCHKVRCLWDQVGWVGQALSKEGQASAASGKEGEPGRLDLPNFQEAGNLNFWCEISQMLNIVHYLNSFFFFLNTVDQIKHISR